MHLGKYDPVEDYFWKSALKERGWTNGAIEKFLGKCDATKDNPHSKRQPLMKLWLKSKVEEAEQSEAFQEWQNKTVATRKAASDRMTEKMDLARKETIKKFSAQIRQAVKRALSEIKSIEELEEDALRHWAANKEDRQRSREEWKPVIAPSREEIDGETRQRWVENYVRHQLTDYERLLNDLFGEIGRDAAYKAMKSAVSQEVEQFYRKQSGIPDPAQIVLPSPSESALTPGDEVVFTHEDHPCCGQVCKVQKAVNSLFVRIIFPDGYETITSERRLQKM